LTVLLHSRFPVDGERIKEFEDRATRLLAAMRAAPGLLWADASRIVEGEPSYLIASEWRTDADADAFDAGNDVSAFVADLDVLLRGDPSYRRFTAR
jgi:quinol monooxygenase YgiN